MTKKKTMGRARRRSDERVMKLSGVFWNGFEFGTIIVTACWLLEDAGCRSPEARWARSRDSVVATVSVLKR